MVPLRRLSLRHKLPLLVTAITAGALVIGGTLAYVEIKTANRAAAEARLRQVQADLTGLNDAGTQARAALEERIASSALVRAALRGAPLDTGNLFVLLDSLRTGPDGPLPVRIVRPDGTIVHEIGTLPVATDPDPIPPMKSERAYGHFRPVDGRALYWRTIPVPGPDQTPIAWIAQRRRIGDAQSAALQALLGRGLRVRLGQVDDSLWVDLGGAILEEPPTEVRLSDPFVYARADGSEALAVAGPLGSTPWVMLIEMPMAQVMSRPWAFRRQAIAVGLVLLVMAVVISWSASRRLVVPLRELAGAAGAMAAGDYRSRVVVEGDDEVGQLGRTFNTMAAQVARSDEELRRRLEEARHLAVELERARGLAERAHEEARAASKAKSEFLAHMSHEIRTPINAVIGYTELLQLGIPDPPSEQQTAYLDRIDRSSQLLVALIDDVLDLSRIESGQTRVDDATGVPEEALKATVAALQPEADRKGISLTSDCEVDAAFRGDPQRVQQILLNFVSNAVKFTPEGGSVRASCSEADEVPPGVADAEGEVWLRFDVTDTGIGIEPAQIDRVFEPFVQVQGGPPKEHGGAGLGLAISRRLATMMEGHITVESEPGAGSRFTLWLRGAPMGERMAAAG